MKLCCEQDLFIIYLNNYQLKNIDFSNLDNLEIYFKKILEKIKNKYNIAINGYYLIDIYKDENYGAIIEIKKEFDDYYEYDNQIEMTVFLHNNLFLYEISDITDFVNKKYKIYTYRKKCYISIENCEFLTLGKVLEYATIEYKTEEIIKYGKIIEL